MRHSLGVSARRLARPSPPAASGSQQQVDVLGTRGCDELRDGRGIVAGERSSVSAPVDRRLTRCADKRGAHRGSLAAC
eukprot:365184-Chlamydomonas_euryale.AAC.3